MLVTASQVQCLGKNWTLYSLSTYHLPGHGWAFHLHCMFITARHTETSSEITSYITWISASESGIQSRSIQISFPLNSDPEGISAHALPHQTPYPTADVLFPQYIGFISWWKDNMQLFLEMIILWSYQPFYIRGRGKKEREKGKKTTDFDRRVWKKSIHW